MAQRDENILQLGARVVVGVHVATGHACDPQPARERDERAITSAVMTGIGPLQLDPQAPRPEGVEQSPRRRLVADAALGAAGQTDQALGVFEQGGQLDRGLAALTAGAIAGVRVSAGENPAQVAPAMCVGDEQRQVRVCLIPARRPAYTRVHLACRIAAPQIEVDLDTVDRPYTARRRSGQLHRARHRVVVGQRQRGMP